MKYEIKQVNDTNAVVILSEEIKINDWVIDLETNTLFQVKEQKLTGIIRSDTDTFIEDACKKIIATIYSFKLEGLPMLELPNQEEDVEIDKLVLDYCIETKQDNRLHYFIRNIFRAGYKAAQKQYSEEDMRDIYNYAKIPDVILYLRDGTKKIESTSFENFIQSLQKKQFPIAVELTEDFKPLKWYYE